MAGVSGVRSRTRRFKGGERGPKGGNSGNGEKAPFSAKIQLSQRDFTGFLGGGPEGAASSGGAFRAGVSTGCSGEIWTVQRVISLTFPAPMTLDASDKRRFSTSGMSIFSG